MGRPRKVRPGWAALATIWEVPAELVRRPHAHGPRVHVWTANRWSTLHSLLELGVDGVFTD
jgi:glycerophosphoryl diester phosphodiesterase